MLRFISPRRVVNGACYPHDFPPYPTVWSFFRRARNTGLWDKIQATLIKKAK
ncbi:hypothetical protein E4T83_02900 [Streptococcus sp. AN2]|nr:hypothetical protein E4T83_02900 [Streptococcus sp. AN2]